MPDGLLLKHTLCTRSYNFSAYYSHTDFRTVTWWQTSLICVTTELRRTQSYDMSVVILIDFDNSLLIFQETFTGVRISIYLTSLKLTMHITCIHRVVSSPIYVIIIVAKQSYENRSPKGVFWTDGAICRFRDILLPCSRSADGLL